jgi:hypothetical protein
MASMSSNLRRHGEEGATVPTLIQVCGPKADGLKKFVPAAVVGPQRKLFVDPTSGLLT